MPRLLLIFLTSLFMLSFHPAQEQEFFNEIEIFTMMNNLKDIYGPPSVPPFGIHSKGNRDITACEILPCDINADGEKELLVILPAYEKYGAFKVFRILQGESIPIIGFTLFMKNKNKWWPIFYYHNGFMDSLRIGEIGKKRGLIAVREEKGGYFEQKIWYRQNLKAEFGLNSWDSAVRGRNGNDKDYGKWKTLYRYYYNFTK